ncbi:hypothetical protein TRVL_07410 [Trypanosoma vivax]|uniref:Uncharacterized protein n=1 Tax=Trypanosoma vivax (strain Y486) TaxID=1055687 RepID=G0TWK1_TRYVY|nr:hypothetical protein TRVL_07410 [Trypanosoma vivax]CCC48339.1 hypothetical protein TVY486_0601300 [Trypanosoma vivax Y486]
MRIAVEGITQVISRTSRAPTQRASPFRFIFRENTVRVEGGTTICGKSLLIANVKEDVPPKREHHCSVWLPVTARMPVCGIGVCLCFHAPCDAEGQRKHRRCVYALSLRLHLCCPRLVITARAVYSVPRG